MTVVWQFGQRTVANVGLIDDEADSRNALGWLIGDAELQAVPFSDPLPDLDGIVTSLPRLADAIVCDHHLRVANYANFDGAQIVSRSVQVGYLAVLCTRYTGTDIESIRPFLPHIPVLVRPDELNEPEELYAAFQECAAEIDGDIAPARKQWRAQVVVERIDASERAADVSVPAWTIEESIRLRYEYLPERLVPQMKVGARFHAWVNLGAESADRLFVVDWEFDEHHG